MPTREPANERLDPDVLPAAVIEAVAENLLGDDTDVIELLGRQDKIGTEHCVHRGGNVPPTRLAIA